MSEVTAGSIKALYDNNKNSPLAKFPCVQIINIKSVETNGKTRYRALVSDGIHYMQAMLATQYAPIVEQGKIKRNSIVRLRETVCNELQFRKILIVLELDVVETEVDLRVGSPVVLESNMNPASPVPSIINGRSMSVASSSSSPSSTPSNPSQQQYQQQSRPQSYTPSSFNNPMKYQQQEVQFHVKQEERQFQLKQEDRQYQQQQQERQYQQHQQERQYQQQQQFQRSQAYTSSQPFSQSTQPFNQPTQSFTQSTQPFNQSTQPFNQSTQSFTQSSQPFTQSTQPFTQSTQPFTQSSQSFTQSSQPFTQSSQSFTQSSQPFTQYTQSNYDSQPAHPSSSKSGPISCSYNLMSSSKSSLPPSASYSIMSTNKSKPRSSTLSSQSTTTSLLPSSQRGAMGMISASQQSVGRIETPLLRIKDLTPYVRNWAIKARVSMKTPIRTWNNARSSGRLFTVNFVDESGEIGATGFNDQVTRFFDLLQDECVYVISKAKIAMNNKRFSNLSSDYELHLESGTDIKPCIDDGTIPFMKINQIRLIELDKYPLHSIVDVMCIVVEDKGMFEVVKRTHGPGKLVHKREILVVDMSLKKVKFTLWDDEARDFDSRGNPVIVCKGARVGNYEGPYLSTSPNTTLKRNPMHPDAKKLKEWYDTVGFRLEYTTFQPFGTEQISDKLPKVSITNAIAENFGHIDKPDYFVCRATITYIKPDNSIYAGCPDCKKKTSINNGQWWCERCEKFYTEPVWKYILTISIDDDTAQLFVNMFDELTTRQLGLNAQQFLTLKETDEEASENVINKILFNTYNFKIRARQEIYNDFHRIKYQVMEMNEINYVKESRALINDISGLL